METQYVIASGNPFDGLSLIGPFDSVEEATEDALIEYDKLDWHVVALVPPEGNS